MTRISSVNDPAYQIEVLKARIEALERRNPLNNSSIDPDAAGISAGSSVFNAGGFQFPWGGELRSMGSVATGLNSKADGIQAYAEDIDARQAVKPTTSWVQAQLNALQSQIDGAAGSGTVDALAQRVASLEASRVQFVQLFSQIIVAMEVQPGHTRPTPPNQNG